MSTTYLTLGERCDACNATEADCARMNSCCPLCSHFQHLDAHGNSVPTGRLAKRPRSVSTLNVTVHPARRAQINRALHHLGLTP